MGYVYLDSHFDEHPKVLEAGPRAAWLYIRGLLYCHRNHTPGIIPKAVVPSLNGSRKWRECAAKLHEVGLWIEHVHHYEVHNYMQWNARSYAARDRAKRAAQARWHPENGDAPSNAQAYAQAMPDAYASSNAVAMPTDPKNQRTKEQQHVSGQLTSIPDQRRELLLKLANQAADRTQPANRPAYLAVTLKALHRDHSTLSIQELETMLNQPAHKPKDPPEAARRDYDHTRPACETCNGSNWKPAPDGKWMRCDHQTLEPEPF